MTIWSLRRCSFMDTYCYNEIYQNKQRLVDYFQSKHLIYLCLDNLTNCMCTHHDGFYKLDLSIELLPLPLLFERDLLFWFNWESRQISQRTQSSADQLCLFEVLTSTLISSSSTPLASSLAFAMMPSVVSGSPVLFSSSSLSSSESSSRGTSA